MSISFSGLASGLDTASWVTSLTALKQAKVTTLQTQVDKAVTARDTLSSIKSFFATFRSKIEKITDSKFKIANMDIFSKKIAQTSNAAKVTATAKADAAEGTYEVKVNQLATNTQVQSGYRYKTQIVTTTQATDMSSLKHMGITAGDIKVDHNGVISTISISENETMNSLLAKFHDVGIAASFNNNTGVFSFDVGIDGIWDTGLTGFVDKLHLTGVNHGYRTENQLNQEEVETVYHIADRNTKLSDLGVTVGSENSKLTIEANGMEYTFALEQNETMGTLIDAMLAEHIQVSLTDGVFNIENALITNDGNTNLLSTFGMQSAVANATQTSDALQFHTVYVETTTATSDSYLRNLNGANFTAGDTLIVKNEAGNQTTITLNENSKISDLVSAMNSAGLTASFSDGVLSIDNGWIVGGTYDIESVFGLEYTTSPSIVTGGVLSETITTHATATLSSKLVGDLGATTGNVKITDSSGTAHLYSVSAESTLQDFLNAVNGYGLSATYDGVTGVVTLHGGTYESIGGGSDLFSVMFGEANPTPDSYNSASSVSQALKVRTTVTIQATNSTTLSDLGIANQTVTFNTDTTVNINSSWTMDQLVSNLRSAGLDASFDPDTHKLTVENATYLGATGNFTSKMGFVDTITGKYVTSNTLVGQSITLGTDLTSAGIVFGATATVTGTSTTGATSTGDTIVYVTTTTASASQSGDTMSYQSVTSSTTTTQTTVTTPTNVLTTYGQEQTGGSITVGSTTTTGVTETGTQITYQSVSATTTTTTTYVTTPTTSLVTTGTNQTGDVVTYESVSSSTTTTTVTVTTPTGDTTITTTGVDATGNVSGYYSVNTVTTTTTITVTTPTGATTITTTGVDATGNVGGYWSVSATTTTTTTEVVVTTTDTVTTTSGLTQTGATMTYASVTSSTSTITIPGSSTLMTVGTSMTSGVLSYSTTIPAYTSTLPVGATGDVMTWTSVAAGYTTTIAASQTGSVMTWTSVTPEYTTTVAATQTGSVMTWSSLTPGYMTTVGVTATGSPMVYEDYTAYVTQSIALGYDSDTTYSVDTTSLEQVAYLGVQTIHVPGGSVNTTPDITGGDGIVCVTENVSLSDLISNYTTIGIGTAEALQELASIVNSGTSCLGKTFVLTDDIDLDGITWESIGTSSNKFRGNFDGNYHTISNLTTSDHGLFGYVDLGTISNVVIDGVYITPSGNNVGALIGYAASVEITNCATRNGTISSTQSVSVGGLVGQLNGGRITRCSSDIVITGNSSKSGGLVGSLTGYINESYATGNVTGGGKIGGLVGETSGYYYCSFTSVYAGGTVSGTSDLGRLIGSQSNGNFTLSSGSVKSGINNGIAMVGSNNIWENSVTETGTNPFGNSVTISSGATISPAVTAYGSGAGAYVTSSVDMTTEIGNLQWDDGVNTHYMNGGGVTIVVGNTYTGTFQTVSLAGTATLTQLDSLLNSHGFDLSLNTVNSSLTITDNSGSDGIYISSISAEFTNASGLVDDSDISNNGSVTNTQTTGVTIVRPNRFTTLEDLGFGEGERIVIRSNIKTNIFTVSSTDTLNDLISVFEDCGITVTAANLSNSTDYSSIRVGSTNGCYLTEVSQNIETYLGITCGLNDSYVNCAANASEDYCLGAYGFDENHYDDTTGYITVSNESSEIVGTVTVTSTTTFSDLSSMLGNLHVAFHLRQNIVSGNIQLEPTEGYLNSISGMSENLMEFFGIHAIGEITEVVCRPVVDSVLADADSTLSQFAGDYCMWKSDYITLDDSSEITVGYVPAESQLGQIAVLGGNSIEYLINAGYRTIGISTIEDLAKLVDETRNGLGTEYVTFVLMNDIDCTSSDDWNGIADFRGKFDGNYHTISNLGSSRGLFENLEDGCEVANLCIDHARIRPIGGSTGILANFASGNVTIKNCSVKDSTIALHGYYIGGLIGACGESYINISGTSVTNCQIDGDPAAGFIGEMQGNAHVVINNSFADGNYSTGSNKHSGITYYIDGDAVLELSNVYVGESSVSGLTCSIAKEDAGTLTLSNVYVSTDLRNRNVTASTNYDHDVIFTSRNPIGAGNTMVVADAVDNRIHPDVNVAVAANLMTAINSNSVIGIGSEAVLAELAKIVNGTNGYTATTCEGKTFVLTTDLNLADYSDWIAIGDGSGESFMGIFNGNGYTISNLTSHNSGLFGIIDGAEITNVVIDGIDIKGGDPTGALVGYATNSNITNCAVKNGTITAAGKNIGGLAGLVENCVISNCYSEVDIDGITYRATQIGGLIGCMSMSDLQNCYATGYVGGDYYIGGLIGRCIDSTIKSVYAGGEVSSRNGDGGTIIGTDDGNLTIVNAYYNAAFNANSYDPVGNTNDYDNYIKEKYANPINLNAGVTAGSIDLWTAIQTSNIIGIGSADVLEELAYIVNSGYDCEGKTFVLTNDIDLSGIADWKVIGVGSYFRGNFDGNYHTISGITSTSGGLFGVIDRGGSVSNLCIDGVDISTSAENAGVLAGSVDRATITNCIVKNGTITATGTALEDIHAVGGLVGKLNGAEVYGCASDISVEASYCYAVGGLIGTVYGTVMESYSTGEIIGNAGCTYLGGFAGEISGNDTYVACCYAGEDSITRYSTVTKAGTFAGNIHDGDIGNCLAKKVLDSTDPLSPSTYYDTYGSGSPLSIDIENIDATTIDELHHALNDHGVSTTFDDENGSLDLTPSVSDTHYIYKLGENLKSILGWGETWEEQQMEFYTTVTATITGSSPLGDVGITIGEGTTIGNFHIAVNSVATTAAELNSLLSSGTTTIGIANSAALAALATAVNGGNDCAGKTFVLTGDIDLIGYNNWTSIGDTTNRFRGNFNGNNYTISNLTISGTSANGLFGCAENSAISNLTLSTVSVSSTSGGVGALVGTGYNCTIDYCDVLDGSVAITSNAYSVGGLVGNGSSIRISNSSSNASVSGRKESVGGLVGAVGYCTIENSYTTGNVNGNIYVGGVIGYASNDIVLSSVYAGGTVTGYQQVGRVIGLKESLVNTTITLSDTSVKSGINNGMNMVGSSSAYNNSVTETATNTVDVHAGLSAEATTAAELNEMISAGYTTIGITNASVLAALATVVNGGNDCSGVTFVLTDDIDLSSYNNWTAIGDSAHNFGGNFDGNYHTISNLTMSGQNTGLFGFVTNGSISNLCIDIVTANSVYADNGVLAAHITNSTITNCATKNGLLTSGDNAMNNYGGLVGCAENSRIEGCSSDINLDGGGSRKGGLIGESSNSTIINSFSTGYVSANNIGSYDVGGLIGRVTNGTTLTNVYAGGNVACPNRHGRLIGGLQSGALTISDAYVEASVNNNMQYVGGTTSYDASISEWDSSTKLTLLGVTTGTHTISTSAGTIELNVTADTSLNNLISFLNNNTIPASFTNGILTCDNTGNYIISMDSNLETSLKFNTGDGYTYNSNTIPAAYTTYDATGTMTFGELDGGLGELQTGYIKLLDGTSINITSTTTLSALQTTLANNGINTSNIVNGRMELLDTGSGIITDISSNVANLLGWQITYTTNTVASESTTYNATGSITFGQIDNGFQPQETGYIKLLDGTSINITATTSLADLKSTLALYDINTGEITNGRMNLLNTGSGVITEMSSNVADILGWSTTYTTSLNPAQTNTVLASMKPIADITMGQRITPEHIATTAAELSEMISAGYTTIGIANATVLAALATAGYCEGKTFVLTNDIDLSDYDNWTPIGGSSGFKGNFDGNYHTISNLTSSKASNACYAGLFGRVWGGTVSNLCLDGVSIEATGTSNTYSSGALAGDLYGATVINCAVRNGTVTSSAIISGGLIGQMESSSTILNSSSDVTVNGSGRYKGGLVCAFIGSSYMENCYASGDVISSYGSTCILGGLIAAEQGGTIVSACSSGTVTDTSGASTKVGKAIGEIQNMCTLSNMVVAAGVNDGMQNIGSTTSYDANFQTQDVSTKLTLLGVTTGSHTITTSAGTLAINVTADTSLRNLVDLLNTHTVGASFSDGRLTCTNDVNYIMSMDMNLEEALHFSAGSGHTYDVNIVPGSEGSTITITNTSSTTLVANSDTTFGDLGLSENEQGFIKVYNTSTSTMTTITVTSSTTLGGAGGLRAKLRAAGVNTRSGSDTVGNSITSGQLDLLDTGSGIITSISSNIGAILGWNSGYGETYSVEQTPGVTHSTTTTITSTNTTYNSSIVQATGGTALELLGVHGDVVIKTSQGNTTLANTTTIDEVASAINTLLGGNYASFNSGTHEFTINVPDGGNKYITEISPELEAALGINTGNGSTYNISIQSSENTITTLTTTDTTYESTLVQATGSTTLAQLGASNSVVIRTSQGNTTLANTTTVDGVVSSINTLLGGNYASFNSGTHQFTINVPDGGNKYILEMSPELESILGINSGNGNTYNISVESSSWSTTTIENTETTYSTSTVAATHHTLLNDLGIVDGNYTILTSNGEVTLSVDRDTEIGNLVDAVNDVAYCLDFEANGCLRYSGTNRDYIISMSPALENALNFRTGNEYTYNVEIQANQSVTTTIESTNTTYTTLTYTATSATTLGQLGFAENETGTITLSNGNSTTVSAGTQISDLKTWLNNRNVSFSIDGNGVVTLGSNSAGTFVTSATSNLANALHIEVGYGETYTSDVSFTGATTATKFSQLGLASGNYTIQTSRGDCVFTVSENTTIGNLVTALNNTLDDDIVSFTNSELLISADNDDYILSMPSQLAAALNFNAGNGQTYSVNITTTYNTTTITSTNTTYDTTIVTATADTTFGLLGLQNGAKGYIVTKNETTGVETTITVESSTTLGSLRAKLTSAGVSTTSVTNGRIDLVGDEEDTSYILNISSNIAGILGWNYGLGQTYGTVVETHTASDDTTLETLGLTYNGIIHTSDGDIEISKDRDLYFVMDKLSEYGISSRLRDGVFEIGQSSDTGVVTGMSANLTNALGGIMTGLDYTYTVADDIDDRGGFVTMTTSMTMKDIKDSNGNYLFGNSFNGTIVINGTNGGNVVVTSNTTVQQFLDGMNSHGYTATLTNGILSLKANGDNYILSDAGGILSRLNITGATYTVDDKKLGETKITDLRDSGGTDLNISTGILGVVQNGITRTVTVEATDTVDSLAAKLANYGITMNYGTAHNGQISFTSTGDTYLTNLGGSDILSKIGAASWNAVHKVESSEQQYITNPNSVISASTKATELRDASGNSLGISTGTYKIVSNGVTYEKTVGADTTLADIFSDLSLYGISASIDSEGRVSLGAASNTYLRYDGSVGESNIVNELFSTWTYGNVYNSEYLDVVKTPTQTATRDTKLSNLTSGTYVAGNLTVSDTVTGTTATITLSENETVGSFMDTLTLHGFSSYLNSEGRLVIQNDGNKTIKTPDVGGSNAMTILGLNPSAAWDQSGQYGGYITTQSVDVPTTIAADRDTLLSDLGVTEGKFYIYANGVRNEIELSSDETLGTFFEALNSYGLHTTLKKNSDNSVIIIQGKGDSYIARSNSAGASNIVEALGLDTYKQYNYDANLKTTEYVTTTIVASNEIFVSDYDRVVDGVTQHSEGTFAVEVDGQYSEIHINSYETFGSLIEKFDRAGIKASLTDGFLQLETGNITFSVIEGSTTSNILSNLGLTYNENLGNFAASSEAVFQSVTTLEDRTLSVANYADMDTQLSLMNISSGNLSIYRNGKKASIEVNANETLGQLRSKINSAYTQGDVDIRVENGHLTFFSTNDDIVVQVGSSVDTTNLSTVCGFSENEDGTVSSAKELYKINTFTRIMESGIFRRSSELGDVTAGTFTIGDDTFTIDENTTIAGIIGEINASEKSNATAYWDSVDGKMVITARTTGSSLVNIEAGTSNFTDLLGLTNTDRDESGNAVVTRLQRDAQEMGKNSNFTINGTRFSSTSNIITSDVSRINGITFNLKDATEGESVTITVGKDKEAAQTAVQEFVDAYNELITAVDEEVSKDGLLADQYTLKTIRNQIRNLLTSTYSGPSAFTSLSVIGISTQGASSGNISTLGIDTLYLDADKFLEQYSKDADSVKHLLVGDDNNNGILMQIENVVENALTSVSGYFSSADSTFAKTIQNLNDKIAKANKAVEAYRARLENKFQSMDMLISKMQNQYNSFLS